MISISNHQALTFMPRDWTEVFEAGEPLALTAFFDVSERGELLFLRLELEPAGERKMFCSTSLHLALHKISQFAIIH